MSIVVYLRGSSSAKCQDSDFFRHNLNKMLSPRAPALEATDKLQKAMHLLFLYDFVRVNDNDS